MNARIEFQVIVGKDGKPAFVVVHHDEFRRLKGGFTHGTVPNEVVNLSFERGVSLGWLALKQTPEQIIADCPELRAQDIRACLAYAADRESHEVPAGVRQRWLRRIGGRPPGCPHLTLGGADRKRGRYRKRQDLTPGPCILPPTRAAKVSYWSPTICTSLTACLHCRSRTGLINGQRGCCLRDSSKRSHRTKSSN